MQLGLFMQPVHDTRRDYTEILEQDRQTVILADKLGFRECWIGEHIAATTEPITSPLVFLASLLQETKQIQLGTGVFCLSIKHPAVVAAEAAMFDHLARGRFQMGIGTGGLSSDLELFKVAGDVDRGRMMRESIDMILKLWAGQPPYELKGEFWDISIGSIRELYASPCYGGGEAGSVIGAGGEADEVEPAQVVVQIAGGDAAAGTQEVLQPAVAAVHRLHMQIAPNPFPHRAVECFVAHPERGGARWVARAAVGDQQGVLRDHRVEGSRERRRIDPGQHRAPSFRSGPPP